MEAGRREGRTEWEAEGKGELTGWRGEGEVMVREVKEQFSLNWNTVITLTLTLTITLQTPSRG